MSHSRPSRVRAAQPRRREDLARTHPNTQLLAANRVSVSASGVPGQVLNPAVGAACQDRRWGPLEAGPHRIDRSLRLPRCAPSRPREALVTLGEVLLRIGQQHPPGLFAKASDRPCAELDVKVGRDSGTLDRPPDERLDALQNQGSVASTCSRTIGGVPSGGNRMIRHVSGRAATASRKRRTPRANSSAGSPSPAGLGPPPRAARARSAPHARSAPEAAGPDSESGHR